MKNIFILLLITSSLLAWETTTHRAIDRTALENAQTKNLKKFIADSSLENENYDDEIFKDYGMTYIDYVEKGELNGMSGLDPEFNDAKYQSLIEAGTMLEDAQWFHRTPYDFKPNPSDLELELYDTLDSADGRFMNHFYNAQGWICKSLKCATTDAISWAYDSGGNDYDYMDAMRYFAKGFSESDTNERRKYQAKMFVSVGHMMHDIKKGRV